jgi:hypothetical protein
MHDELGHFCDKTRRLEPIDTLFGRTWRRRQHVVRQLNKSCRHAGDSLPVKIAGRLVGLAVFLVPKTLPGISEVIDVPHREVANAIGAAIAQVSGEVDQIVSDCDRATAINRATALARERARNAGAAESSLAVTENRRSADCLPAGRRATRPGASCRRRARATTSSKRSRAAFRAQHQPATLHQSGH